MYLMFLISLWHKLHIMFEIYYTISLKSIFGTKQRSFQLINVFKIWNNGEKNSKSACAANMTTSQVSLVSRFIITDISEMKPGDH